MSKPLSDPPHVHRLWRTAIVGLLIGATAHAFLSHRSENPPLPFVRGDDLPAHDPRLSTHLPLVEFDNTKLGQAFSTLSKESGLNIEPDWAALNNLSITADDRVTLHLKDIGASDALQTVLEGLESTSELKRGTLRWDEQNGIVKVTTIAAPGGDSVQPLYIRIYNVSALLAKKFDVRAIDSNYGQDLSDSPTQQLRKMIIDVVMPETWRDNGPGTRSISVMGNDLVITQTAQAHEKIESLLRDMTETP